MMVKRILVILLSCFAVVSCKTARIKKELKEFTGQQIVLPDSLRSTVNGRDTTLTDFMGAETKLVVFYDSVVCSSCRINRMYEWQEVIATSIGLKHKFNAIFIFSPKRGTESQLITSLKAAQLDYPVFLDSGGLFLKRNLRPGKCIILSCSTGRTGWFWSAIRSETSGCGSFIKRRSGNRPSTTKQVDLNNKLLAMILPVCTKKR